MPELPEVETIKIGLMKLLPGKAVKDVYHDWPGSKPGEYIRYSADVEAGYETSFSRQNTPGIPPRNNSFLTQPQTQLTTRHTTPAYSKSFPNAPADVARFLIGSKITAVRRRAKVLIIDLSSKYSLVVHLKMTGQLVFRGEESFGAGHPSKDLFGALPAKSTRVVIEFKDGSKLFFNDQRKFGWMRLMPTIEIPEIDFFKKVGPEPLEDNFTVNTFVERLTRRKNSSIKAVLLDQTVLAGVGNIYADESLFLAKIHPATPVSAISRAELVSLYNSIRTVLRMSIEKGGSSDRNYVDASGGRGSYLEIANVFRREGKLCPRCGTEIIKTRVAGRGTHVCPYCQKPPKL